jgi:hypothetical protein
MILVAKAFCSNWRNLRNRCARERSGSGLALRVEGACRNRLRGKYWRIHIRQRRRIGVSLQVDAGDIGCRTAHDAKRCRKRPRLCICGGDPVSFLHLHIEPTRACHRSSYADVDIRNAVLAASSDNAADKLRIRRRDVPEVGRSARRAGDSIFRPWVSNAIRRPRLNQKPSCC